MNRIAMYRLLSIIVCVVMAFSMLGINALAQYGEDVYDAYTEYMFEYLTAAQDKGLISEEQVYLIMPLVSQKQFEELADMGVYDGTLLGDSPLTIDKFAGGDNSGGIHEQPYSEDQYAAYTEYIFETLDAAREQGEITEDQLYSIMSLVSRRAFDELEVLGLYDGVIIHDAPLTISEFVAGSDPESDKENEYSEDVYLAYTEYIFETLDAAREQGEITEDQVYSIMSLVSQRRFAEVTELGLYNGRIISDSPMTIDEFAGKDDCEGEDPEPPQMEDLTGDGYFTEADAKLILAYVIGSNTDLNESTALQAIADVDNNKTIDSRDATQIMRFASGISSVFEEE